MMRESKSNKKRKNSVDESLFEYLTGSVDIDKYDSNYDRKLKMNNMAQYLIKKMLTFSHNPVIFSKIEYCNVLIGLVTYIRILK